MGEEVKAKNENRLTSAHAYAREEAETARGCVPEAACSRADAREPMPSESVNFQSAMAQRAKKAEKSRRVRSFLSTFAHVRPLSQRGRG